MLLQQVHKSVLNILPICLEDVPARYMNPGELEVLVALIRWVGARKMVEFGCNIGRTAKILLRECPSIKEYVGVDVLPNTGYNPACKVQRRELPQNPGILAADDTRFHLLLKRRGTLDLTQNDLGSADAVFIDGDHSFEVVMHDTLLATKILTPGGIIVWHDYHQYPTVEVKQVLEYLQGRGRKIKHIGETWLAYERRP